MSIAAKAIAQRLTADTSDRRAAEPSLRFGSGPGGGLRRSPARRLSQRRFGEMTLTRAYYVAIHARQVFGPRDRAHRT